ncbi:sporulation integral membrane protein YtvI [Natranaerovirga pectinivora]|uniref:Sporulation integral membrane protein YtvI n=1 Tax=Natranaerovirga pectinivora TaxID=682400 RepID=A0A4R3MLY2_9FIRM|nr:sporulation integral membrane protein YtvI [Natranaerovirga pectinivora]TCT13940.1 sporulation integral membrane protein YtvI [Natranaerovirga pectinivora]
MTDKNNKQLINLTIVGITLVFIYFFTIRLISVFLPFILGYFIAVIIEPIIKVFNKYLKIPRAFSSLLAVISFLSIVGLIGNIIIRKLVTEFKSFVIHFPEYKDQVILTLENWGYSFDRMLGYSQGSTKDMVINNWDEIGGRITRVLTPGVTDGSLNLVSSLPGFMFFMIITLIATFFISKDRHKIRIFLSKQMHTKWKEKFNLIRKALVGAFFGYVKAQLTLMVIIGVVCTIGLLIIRNPYALLIGLIICILDALPVFGSGTVLIPWALFKAFSGDLQYAVWLGIIYGTAVLIRQFLEPKLVGDNIGVHPLATLMAIYIGVRVFGVVGIILGPLILIFIKTLQEVEVLPKWKS